MQRFVCKFGGSSLANAAQFKKVAEIIKDRPVRKYIVVSAPGKRNDDDVKVTDMLYSCYYSADARQDYSIILGQIRDRFAEIVEGLSINFDLDAEIEEIKKNLSEHPMKDYMASRGEYLNAKIMAKFLGFEFVDAADAVRFDQSGEFLAEQTNRDLNALLSNKEYVVIPGFYGARPDGQIQTFSRGGSDITGSIVARAIFADMYENWTDVSGMLSADPRIIKDPFPILALSYRELRELSYMGASVLHEDAVFPIRKANIPLNIRNTNHPDDPGTLISAELPRVPRKHKVTGIAGKKGFSAVLIEKSSMNSEVGFGMKLLKIFADHGVSFEHTPTGIDTMSVVVQTSLFNPYRDMITEEINNELHPDSYYIEDNLALIAVVGQGMAYSRGTAARIMNALAGARINIKMIDQGSTEINIILGVDEVDYEEAIRAIYNAVM